jgi:CrcB protein
MIDCLVVGVGGFIGAVLRFLMGKIPMKKITEFPINTLLINIIGAFLIGIICAASIKHHSEDSRTVLLLKTGICGGFTTFSTFSLETVTLMQQGKLVMSIIYAVISVITCLVAVWLGEYIVRA